MAGTNYKEDDGIINPILERFGKIKSSTYCPFAEKASIWTSEEWQNNKTLEENLDIAAKALTEFTSKCTNLHLDGFLIEIKGKENLGDINIFSRTLFQSLKYLSRIDPTENNCMENEIMQPDWQFSFNGQRMFIITFASFYTEKHSRFSYNTDTAFIFLQPESSFDFNIIPPASDPRVLKLKEKIRKDFRQNNRSYDETIADMEFEALKYIKPLNIGDPPIYWWNIN